MRNDDVARVLEDIAAALELKAENSFKVRAYQEAARQIGYMTHDVAELHRKGHLDDIPGVGPSIAKKIAEYLDTGKIAYLDQLVGEIPRGVFDLLKVPGIGPRTAHELYAELKITSLPELAEAARQHRLQALPGFGEKTEENILKELGRLQARGTRLPLGVAWALADEIADALRDHPAVIAAEPAGSIRRRRETVGDIDILVSSKDPAGVEKAIKGLDRFKEVIGAGETKISFLTTDAFQIDVRVVEPEAWGSALQHFTGSKAHNIKLRTLAQERGLRINEYGLFRLDDGKRIAGAHEAEIYHALDLDWMPPELREDTGEIEAAAEGKLPQLIELGDVLGDFHTHTTYSDGRHSVEKMARAAMARGYEYLVVTDHSYSLGVTQGLTLEKMRQQRAEIDALNRELYPFRVLAGVELEIRRDCTLDFPDDILALFDVVAASLHTGTRADAGRNTKRMLAALHNPHVHILNHPSGRIVPTRQAYEFAFEAVVEAARAGRKMLEINGSERMDLDAAAARLAGQLGVTLSLGSDAHSVRGLEGMRMAVAIARRAWLEKRDVLNTRHLKALLKRLERAEVRV
jgi:DNA polymerase (family 10)